MFIVTLNYNAKTYANETVYPTIEEVIADIASGQIDADTINKIIDINLTASTSHDVTQFVAIEVWRILDSNNDYAWRDMRNWLESFDLDCEHLNGETGDLARDFYGR
jgi:hypothetical protein